MWILFFFQNFFFQPTCYMSTKIKSCTTCHQNGLSCIACPTLQYPVQLYCQHCLSNQNPSQKCQQCAMTECGKVCATMCTYCNVCCSQKPNDQCGLTPNLINPCQIGQFLNDRNCKVCPSSCATCTSESCISCNINYLLQNEKCRAQCSDGFFVNNGICKVCREECIRCKGEDQFDCQGCKKGYIKTSINNCNRCDEFFYQNSLGYGVCSRECPEGYYFSHNINLNYKQCLNCPSNCQKCTEIFCQSCLKGFFFSQSGACKICPNYCQVCQNQHSCKQCFPGTFVLEEDCWAQCPQNYYGSHLEMKCLQCKSKNKCPPQKYNVSIMLTKKYLDFMMSLAEVPSSVQSYINTEMITNELFGMQMQTNTSYKNITPTQVEYNAGVFKIVSIIPDINHHKDQELKFVYFINNSIFFPQEVKMTHYTSLNFHIGVVTDQQRIFTVSEVMATILASLAFILTFIHYSLYQESNGIIEAYQMVTIFLIFSKNADTDAIFMMKGLLVLLLNFEINYNRNPVFYKYSNLLFISRNNFLFINGSILIIASISLPLLSLAGNFLLRRKKFTYRFALLWLGRQPNPNNQPQRILSNVKSPLSFGVLLLEIFFIVCRVALLLNAITYLVWTRDQNFNLLVIMGFIVVCITLSVDFLICLIGSRIIYNEQGHLLILLRNCALYCFGLIVSLFSNNFAQEAKIVAVVFYWIFEGIRLTQSQSGFSLKIIIPEVLFIVLVTAMMIILTLPASNIYVPIILPFLYLGLIVKIVLVIIKWTQLSKNQQNSEKGTDNENVNTEKLFPNQLVLDIALQDEVSNGKPSSSDN